MEDILHRTLLEGDVHIHTNAEQAVPLMIPINSHSPVWL